MTWLFVSLIVAAMVLFALEILTPFFGLFMGLGLAALGASIITAYTMHPIFGLVMLVFSFLWVPAYLLFFVRVLPKTPLGQHLFLGKFTKRAEPDFHDKTERLQALVGEEGVTTSLLRPGGSVRVHGKRYEASAESGMISGGTPVEVVRATSMELIVRPVDQDPPLPPEDDSSQG